jgi:hypothetical protein
MVGPFDSSLIPNPPELGIEALKPQPDLATMPLPAGDVVNRKEPEVDEKRKALVSRTIEEVKQAKAYWQKPFKQMIADMNFCGGDQWRPDPELTVAFDETWKKDDPRYVANITLRHVQQKVAALYARNPRAVAKRRPRLIAKLWDGTQAQVQVAMQLLQQNPMNPKAMQIVQDYNATLEYNQMMDRVAKTLEYLYEYQINEQDYPFKAGMKRMVRRAITCGVGYVKLGFQRFMKENPEIAAQNADYSQRLATLEQLSADVADGDITDPNAPERERIQLLMQDMQNEDTEIVAREGLLYSYPMPYSVIPDMNCIDLNGFIGSDWVAEEMLLTPDRLQQIYGVDVGQEYTPYWQSDGTSDDATAAVRARISGQPMQNGTNITPDSRPQNKALAWQVWNRTEGLVYTVCDGYCDFLEQPAAPFAWTERFWPWWSLTLNDCESATDIFPPSDVRLIRDMQREINRSREGLREHRVANRPKTAVAAGVLDEEDIAKLQDHPANAVLELNALSPGQKIEDVLQPIHMPGIDPNLYDVSPAFQDIERVVGVQEANLGGTSSSTATESSIAESSRQTQLASNIDDLNELLSGLAKAGGQILLTQMQPTQVTDIVGPGAVWPQLSREEVAREIQLQIKAGSTGKPNQAQEIANAEKLVPLLLQIPGVSPEWVLEQIINAMGSDVDLTEAFVTGMPSIAWLNSSPMGLPGLGNMIAPPANQNALPTPPMSMGGGGGGVQPAQAGGTGIGTGDGTDPMRQGKQGILNGPRPPPGPPNDPLNPAQPMVRDYARNMPV